MTRPDWNLTMVKAREALVLMPRLPGSDDRIDWREVEVAHVDTGCTRHSVLGPWSGDHSDILRVEDGLNLMERGQPPFDPIDYHGTPAHGTRTGSVLCGDLPGRLVGIAPGLPTIPYRAMNSTVLTTKASRKRVAESIRHAVDINAAEVVSMSIGFPQMSLFAQRHLGSAVDHAYEAGVILVAAGGQVIDRVTYPGRFSRTIGVGGVSPNGEAWFRYQASSAKQSIDVWAPSDDVLRANSKLEGGQVVEDRDAPGDGTSYGTVHVAAAAAMWLACHGEAIERDYDQPWQRIEAFRRLLAETSQPVKGRYWPTRPRGILDIEALLKAPLPGKASLAREDRKAADQVF